MTVLLNRDSKLKLALLAGCGAVGGCLAWATGLRFPWGDAVAPIAVAATLGPCAAFYERRNAEQFVSTLMAAIYMLLFTAVFTVLMYSLATFDAPLRDDMLARFDAACGIHVPDIVAWFGDRPALNTAVTLAYNSVLPQTFILILVLGMKGERRPLEEFVLRMIIALVLTAAIFAIMPAEGPFAIFGLKQNPTQANYLHHLHGLRDGTMRDVSLRATEGLVTFPSFHTTSAILLALAVWHRRKLFVVLAALNAVVILGTMTTGWHYFADVLAGIAVTIVTVLITNRLRPWLAGVNDESAETEAVAEARSHAAL